LKELKNRSYFYLPLLQFLLDVLGKMEPPTSSRLNSRKRRKDGSGPNGATELDGIPAKMSRRSFVSKQRWELEVLGRLGTQVRATGR